MTEDIILSEEGKKKLEDELQDLKKNRRREVAERISTAKEFGDLSENAEYDAAKEEQGLFELKISKLENVLARARVIDSSQFIDGEVHILSEVKIKNLKTNKIFNYILVSPEEADFQAGKISVTSPVGQGLMGRKAGDKVQVKAPAGILDFEILEIK